MRTYDWWPGGTSRWSSSPTYPHRIKVIDTIGGMGWRRRLKAAIKAWNRCGAVVLYRGTGTEYEPGSITVFRDPQGPYGGWRDDHGIAAFGGFNGIADIEHELGHALGFGHAPNGTNSVMTPNDNLRLTDLDCQGLRHYYGR